MPRIKVISFDEAAELAYFGAKVLHPATVLRPSAKYSRLCAEFAEPDLRRHKVTAARRVRTFSRPSRSKRRSRWWSRAPAPAGARYLKSIFEAFDTHEVAVDVVSTSEVSVSVTAETNEASRPGRRSRQTRGREIRRAQSHRLFSGRESARDSRIAAKVFGILENVKSG